MLTRRDARLCLLAYSVLALPLISTLATSFLVTPVDLATGRIVLSPPCLLRTWLGVACPGCGLTRAFTALSHGELGLALRQHRFSLVTYVVFWWGALWAVRGALRSLTRLRTAASA
jgi:hypothetical protein